MNRSYRTTHDTRPPPLRACRPAPACTFDSMALVCRFLLHLFLPQLPQRSREMRWNVLRYPPPWDPAASVLTLPFSFCLVSHSRLADNQQHLRKQFGSSTQPQARTHICRLPRHLRASAPLP